MPSPLPPALEPHRLRLRPPLPDSQHRGTHLRRGKPLAGTRPGYRPHDFTDAEAVAAVARITNGNFPPIQRLLTQITRIRDINQLTSITKEIVEAMLETLLVGT